MATIVNINDFDHDVFSGLGEDYVYFYPISLKPFTRIICKQGNGVWSEDIFYLLRLDGRISGISGIWDVAVPYNSWTAHIIGTHLPPPPFFQYWF